jgi:hypothetical protein
MADKKVIDVIITEDGEITLDLSGFKGRDCVNETRELEKILGKLIGKKYKKEFNEASSTNKNYS